MTRTWAVVGVMAVAMAGSAATAQERVAPPPEVVAHLRTEPAQVPFTVKMRVPLEANVVTGRALLRGRDHREHRGARGREPDRAADDGARVPGWAGTGSP